MPRPSPARAKAALLALAVACAGVKAVKAHDDERAPFHHPKPLRHHIQPRGPAAWPTLEKRFSKPHLGWFHGNLNDTPEQRYGRSGQPHWHRRNTMRVDRHGEELVKNKEQHIRIARAGLASVSPLGARHVHPIAGDLKPLSQREAPRLRPKDERRYKYLEGTGSYVDARGKRNDYNFALERSQRGGVGSEFESNDGALHLRALEKRERTAPRGVDATIGRTAIPSMGAQGGERSQTRVRFEELTKYLTDNTAAANRRFDRQSAMRDYVLPERGFVRWPHQGDLDDGAS